MLDRFGISGRAALGLSCWLGVVHSGSGSRLLRPRCLSTRDSDLNRPRRLSLTGLLSGRCSEREWIVPACEVAFECMCSGDDQFWIALVARRGH
jgi:hypothetical protein